MQFFTFLCILLKPRIPAAAMVALRCLAVFCIASSTSNFAVGASVSEPIKVRLEWNRNPERNVTGYELRYSTESSISQPVVVNVGNNTRWTLSGLEPETTYILSVRAYNRAGLRSRFADSIRHTTPAVNPPIDENRAPDTRILSPTTGGTVVVGHPVVFSARATDPDGDTPSIRWNFGSGSGIPDLVAASTEPIRFALPGTYQVTATAIDASGLSDPAPDSRTITVIAGESITPREDWSLKFANSQETNGYPASAAIDGNSRTFWHTAWTSGAVPPPHTIELDLATPRHIKGFRYLPRQDRLTVGNIGRYAFYVSTDGTTWGKPTATGTFDASSTEKQVLSTSKFGRYIRLVSLSEVSGNMHAAIAELNVLSGPPPNRRPTARSRSLTTPRKTPLAIALNALDPDGNPITFRITKAPKKGKLTGTFPNFTYQPRKGFVGKDEFTFTVHDGVLVSKTAKIRIQVGTKKKQPKQALAATSRTTTPASSAFSKSTAPSPPAASRPVTSSITIDGAKYLTLTADPSDPAHQASKPLVEVSSDRVKWSSGSRHTTILIDSPNILKVRDNTPIQPGRKRFIRIKPRTPL